METCAPEADRLHPPLPRPPDPLRPGRGADPHRRPRRGQAWPMAVWTPSSYLVREYARNVEEVTAVNGAGEPLAVGKTAKNHWRIAAGRASEIVVRYQVYCREMSVRTNFVDSGFALIVGARTFMTVEGAEALPMRSGWSCRRRRGRSRQARWHRLSGAGDHAYRADDFGSLIDSPVYAEQGSETYPFEVAGAHLSLVNEGEGNVWDRARRPTWAKDRYRRAGRFLGVRPLSALRDLQPPHREWRRLGAQGRLAPDEQPLAGRTREGCTSIGCGWSATRSSTPGTANGCGRWRSAPSTTSAEVYTRDLWVAEGFPSYYGDLLVAPGRLLHRQGVPEEIWSKSIKGLWNHAGTTGAAARRIVLRRPGSRPTGGTRTRATPASATTPKGKSSPSCSTPRIRRAAGGAKSLDDAMRLAFQRYSGERGYRSEELRQVFAEVAGTDLGGWLHDAADTTAELDYQEALDWYGLRCAADPDKAEKKDGEQELPAGWLGMDAAVQDGRLTVTGVKRGTPPTTPASTSATRSSPSTTTGCPLRGWRGDSVLPLPARRRPCWSPGATCWSAFRHLGEKPKATGSWKPAPDAARPKGHLEAWLAGKARRRKVLFSGGDLGDRIDRAGAGRAHGGDDEKGRAPPRGPPPHGRAPRGHPQGGVHPHLAHRLGAEPTETAPPARKVVGLRRERRAPAGCAGRAGRGVDLGEGAG